LYPAWGHPGIEAGEAGNLQAAWDREEEEIEREMSLLHSRLAELEARKRELARRRAEATQSPPPL
jgi:hypothetical protein